MWSNITQSYKSASRSLALEKANLFPKMRSIIPSKFCRENYFSLIEFSELRAGGDTVYYIWAVFIIFGASNLFISFRLFQTFRHLFSLRLSVYGAPINCFVLLIELESKSLLGKSINELQQNSTITWNIWLAVNLLTLTVNSYAIFLQHCWETLPIRY